ncbi:MAG: PhzF family phenazine biosynthesis protein [Prolixibacteraceae bacterium]
MELIMYQIDAFAEKIFSGNPAAVIPLKEWLPGEIMQNIAMENNLSETAFFIPERQNFHIRWFTPVSEVDLCGHATLASAHVIFEHLGFKEDEIIFQSRSGILKVKREGNFIVLNFPASELIDIEPPENIKRALGKMPEKCIKGKDDLMLVFESEETIRALSPDFDFIKTLDARGIIATARSEAFDFVSRFFAPLEGINEDPVTGSAHTMLIPYWNKILNKTEMTAKQISARGGVLHCKFNGDRVEIGGKAISYLTGKITV